MDGRWMVFCSVGQALCGVFFFAVCDFDRGGDVLWMKFGICPGYGG